MTTTRRQFLTAALALPLAGRIEVDSEAALQALNRKLAPHRPPAIEFADMELRAVYSNWPLTAHTLRFTYVMQYDAVAMLAVGVGSATSAVEDRDKFVAFLQSGDADIFDCATAWSDDRVAWAVLAAGQMSDALRHDLRVSAHRRERRQDTREAAARRRARK